MLKLYAKDNEADRFNKRMIRDKEAREGERMHYWIEDNKADVDLYFPELAHPTNPEARKVHRKKHPTRDQWE